MAEGEIVDENTPWLMPKAIFTCRVTLSEEDWAYMVIGKRDTACNLEEILDEWSRRAVGLEDTSDVPSPAVVMKRVFQGMILDDEADAIYGAIAGALLLVHTKWNLEQWAEASGQDAPLSPLFWKTAKQGVRPLKKLPFRVIGRLMCGAHWLCKRAARGNWEEMGNDEKVDFTLPGKLQAQLQEIDAELDSEPDGEDGD